MQHAERNQTEKSAHTSDHSPLHVAKLCSLFTCLSPGQAEDTLRVCVSHNDSQSPYSSYMIGLSCVLSMKRFSLANMSSYNI